MRAAISRFFSPDVVIERRVLWTAWAAQAVAVVAMVAIAVFVIDPSEDDPSAFVLTIEASLFAIYLVCVAVSALLGLKRLQARGKPLWWSLVVLIPFVGPPIYIREVGFRRDPETRSDRRV